MCLYHFSLESETGMQMEKIILCYTLSKEKQKKRWGREFGFISVQRNEALIPTKPLKK